MASVPILKSPPASVPRDWLVENSFSLALWVYDAASGWKTGVSVLMHRSNSLFSTQLTCFSSCFFSWLFSGTLLKTLGTCISANCCHPSEAKGTTRDKVLLLLSVSAGTEIPEGPGANSSPEPVEPVSRKAACQTCFPGRK